MRNDTVSWLSADAQSPDDVFALLGERRRRHAVAFLSRAESAVSLHEVAAAVASREAEPTPEAVTADARRRIAVTLHHNHLPKLDAADVVDYDAETHVVTPTRIEMLASVLRLIDADGN